MPLIIEEIEKKLSSAEISGTSLLLGLWAPGFFLCLSLLILALGVVAYDGPTSSACCASGQVCVAVDTDPWSQLIVLSAGASIGHSVIQLARCIIKFYSGNDKHMLSTSMLIFMTMAQAGAQLAMISTPRERQWEDYFGVRSSPYLWVEWLPTVPLMFYLTTIMNVNKLRLTFEDHGVIITSSIGLLSLYALNFPRFWPYGPYLMLSANVFIEWALVWLHWTSYDDYTNALAEMKAANDISPVTKLFITVKQRKYVCSVYMHICFTLFPIAYFLSYFRVIDHHTLDITISLLNFSSKGVFAMFVTDSHADLLDSKTYMLFAEREKSLERERNSMETEREQLRSLIGNVAHDLKTPLQSIIMDIELLKGEIDLMNRAEQLAVDTTLREMFADYRVQCFMRLANILNSLMSSCSFMKMSINRSVDYTKASSNIKLVPSLETVEFTEAMSFPVTCVNCLQSAVDIVVEEFPKNICTCIITDKHWLSENILCLLSNAVKYSNGGVVRLITEFVAVGKESESKGKGGAMIKVTVEDTGIGITDDQRSLLFKPIRQAHRLTGGTGLGLYSLAKRVEALGGACDAENRKDGKKGASFWFTFPYHPDEKAAKAVSEERKEVDGISTQEQFLGAIRSGVLSPTSTSSHQCVNSTMNQVANVLHGLPLAPSGHAPPTVAPSAATFAIQSSPVTGASPSASAATSAGSRSPAIEAASSHAPPSNRLLNNATASRPHSPTSIRPLNVLIVEDSLAIIKVTSRLLSQCGHTVESALNGSLGLDRLIDAYASHEIDVVLMDIQMPVMDGIECVTKFREYEAAQWQAAGKTEKLPIIGMSANSDSATRQSALAAGMDIFLGKPFTIADLKKGLKKFF